MNRIFFLAFGIVAVLKPFSLSAQDLRNEIADRLRQDLNYLADDQRQGRGVGTQGLQDAGEFIAARYAELGLNTKIFGDSPFQQFTVPFGFAASKATDDQGLPKNRLKLSAESELELTMEQHWNPLSIGANGSFEAEVVFVGYGITAKEQGYDDYQGIDANNKIVIMLRKEPQTKDGSSIFGGSVSRYAYFSAKLANAIQHGAVAMIVINDPKSASNSNDQPMSSAEAGGSIGLNLPALNITRKIIDPVLKHSTGTTLEQLEAQIASTHKPASIALPKLTISGQTHVDPYMAPVRNVGALLPGAGDLADELVIVGAHYDHVGMGGEGSLSPGTIAVHNGADDNGSGTVCIMEVARQLASTRSDNRRSILFLSFAAEERGLLGSEHYVRYPAFPLEKTVAMVNLDMVGRLGDGSLTIFGMGTASEFPTWVDEANQGLGVELDKQNAGLGPSDHQSFYLREIPVFHFFTGLHGEYHRPGDDVDLIDFRGAANIAMLAANLTDKIATNSERPTILKTDEHANIGANAGRKARHPRLGVSFDRNAEKCLVTNVLDPSPAKTAGIQAGDIILRVNDANLTQKNELPAIIQQHKSGDQITIRVLRAEQELDLTVTL